MPIDALSASPTADPADGLVRACPACGEERVRRFGEKNRYPLWECRGCGTLFTRPDAGQGGDERDEIKDLYDHYYDRARFELHPVAEASHERLVRSCEPFRTTGRWLDIGYGEGGLLEIAERHGWSCFGTEVSPPALAFGERRGWVVSADCESDPRFPAAGFDVVTLLECLEHVPEPVRFLRAASRLLRPGGLLHLTTPNARSLNRRLLGLGWSIVSPPEHLTLWTARALRRELANAGFERPKVRAVGFNPFDLRAAWFPRRNGQAAGSRTEMALGLNGALSKSPVRRLVKDAINAGLSLCEAGDSLKAWACRGRGEGVER